MFADNTPVDNHSPPLIHFPCQLLQRDGPEIANFSPSLPSIHSYDGFDRILNLTPNEIVEIQEDQMDYICGVQTNGKTCRKSFYCQQHLLEQRQEVRRSLPLDFLIAEELKNVAWFRNRRILTKLYYDCKAYWQKHPSASMTPMTCSRSSCMKEESHVSCSPKCVSLSSNHAASGMRVNCEKSAFSLLKRAFLKKLSRSADSCKEDMMAYLYHRLASYEVAGIDMRARELEARYSISENECEVG